MVSMLVRKANLRPIASPRRPKSTAPRGRTRKPAENASRAKARSVLSSRSGKNCWPMRGESAAKRLKSYQENAVPSVEAMITLRWAEVARGAVEPGTMTPVAIGPIPVPFGISLQQSARAYQGSVRCVLDPGARCAKSVENEPLSHTGDCCPRAHEPTQDVPSESLQGSPGPF